MQWDDFLKKNEAIRIGVDQFGNPQEWMLSAGGGSNWTRWMSGASSGKTAPKYATPAQEDER